MGLAQQGKNRTRFLLPTLYLAVMVLVVLGVWKNQTAVRKGGEGPLYRNLMECPAWARRGFDPADILKAPAPNNGKWVRFESPPFRISSSSLPDLPQRPYLSPLGRPAQEFTVLIAVEMNNRAITFLNNDISIMPGIFLGYIGENWEVYFNGKMIAREMHIDEEGQIKSRRNWRDVSIPLDKSLIIAGTNTLALRIIGDPAYGVTGLYYTAPYYLDDYRTIERRQQNYLLIILCSISGFLGFYFLFLFLFIRRKSEIIYLYYSIFSLLFCIYSVARNGIVNALIPNSDISIRMEYFALFLMVTMLCFFTEMIVRGKITIISKSYMGFCVFSALSQIFFCAQYGDDVLQIWTITILIYFSYIFFYDVLYFFFGKRSKSGNLETTMIHIMFGAALMYACGIFDVLDVIFFHKSFSLFIYSTFVVHFGLAVTLLWRFNDIYKQTEQSNVILEETVKERTQELQKANRAKSDFLAVMSHEIRTPLNAVIGLSQIELQNQEDGSHRDNVMQIHRSGSYLLGIINDILDISKIESEKFELVPAEYHTSSFIGDTINLSRVRIGSKPIQFILEIDGGFPAKLVGDELRVKQILNNLLSNAVKYTREGTITLSVEWTQKNITPNFISRRHRDTEEKAELANNAQLSVPRTEGSMCLCEINSEDKSVLIRFTVRDTGVGIRPEDREKLFDNYARLDSGANRAAEGTGLGLPIAKKLTEMMGGAVTVESEYGAGSVFCAEIMQGMAGEETIGEETAENLRSFRYASEWEEFVRSFIPPARVLVVDDIPENLLVARGLLSPYGLHVDTAGGGSEAIERIKTTHYGLIFIDHMMPEMDGVETTGVVRELGKSTPIVALTANAMIGMKEYYLEHGFNDYLSKPIDANELDKILVKWIVGENEEWEEPVRKHSVLPTSADNKQKSLFLTPNSPASAAIEYQLLDKLNHCRASFEIGKEFEPAYFARFTALVKSLQIIDADLQKQAALLIEAGQKEDAKKIKEILPAFCDAALREAQKKEQEAMGNENNGGHINDILFRLKKAIQAGDGTAETILGELGRARLDPHRRELYFTLYDLLLKNNTEKALVELKNYFGEVNND